MATENQNFFKHYDDTFNLVFSVTDVTEDLNGYYAFWSCATSPSSSLRSFKNTKTTDNNPGKFTGAPGANDDASSSIDITNTTITVPLLQSDFATSGDPYGLYVGNFYHELIIGSLVGGDDSVVIASGIFTVKEDLGGVVR